MRSIYLILFLVISSFGFSQQARLEELNSLVKPRMRVIIDNDLGGDPDGLFQLAHHLMSPSVEIRGIIASHLYEQGFGGPGTSEYAKEQAMKVINILGLENSVDVYIDKSQSMVDVTKPIDSEAVQVIIKEAMRTDTDLPLYVACGGGLTNIASAYLLEPEIAEKLTLVWIGGPEYADIAIPPPGYTTLEYNLGIDIKAAQVIFNNSNINLWQVPRNVYRQPIMSDAELLIKVKGKGKLGNHLFNVMKEAYTKLDKWNIPMGEVYIYGDNPLVLLTALQSSFEPDPSSSTYVIKQAPLINEEGLYKVNLKGRNIRVYQQLDNRLLFDDFFAKLALLAVKK
ncbi:nucleoside hydrolase [Maribacter litoralis]|uniref:nucleoside hydrolase n=1 Tax=Maribacter litoralis TaxID=2059726 RepID=UPI000E32498C|nr:nucleoside hydrolase [Maribacter litoralis]